MLHAVSVCVSGSATAVSRWSASSTSSTWPPSCTCSSCGGASRRPSPSPGPCSKVGRVVRTYAEAADPSWSVLASVDWGYRRRVCVSNLSEVELFAKKNPKQMLRRLELFLKARQAGSPPGASPDPQAQPPSPGLGPHQARGSQGKELHFSGVCDLPPDMEGEARLI